MKALFLGGDKRQLEIVKDLASKMEVDLIGYENVEIENTTKKIFSNIDVSKYNFIFLPINGIKDDLSITCEFGNSITLPINFFDKFNGKIFTGIKSKKLNEMLETSKKDCIVLMNDLEVKKENSIPTVEGIIGDLVYNTDDTIKDANIFVLGYGNVGRRLIETLKLLQANVTVGVINEYDFNDLVSNKIPCIYTTNCEAMKKIMKEQEIIINTVPEIILNEDYLKVLNQETYILDIASFPHGIDFKAADALKIKNKLLLGIPGKVAPKAAGKILVKKINSIIKEGKND